MNNQRVVNLNNDMLFITHQFGSFQKIRKYLVLVQVLGRLLLEPELAQPPWDQPGSVCQAPLKTCTYSTLQFHFFEFILRVRDKCAKMYVCNC